MGEIYETVVKILGEYGYGLKKLSITIDDNDNIFWAKITYYRKGFYFEDNYKLNANTTDYYPNIYNYLDEILKGRIK